LDKPPLDLITDEILDRNLQKFGYKQLIYRI